MVEKKETTLNDMQELINDLLKDFDQYTAEESEQVEELILDLHRHSKLNDGKITEEFKQRLLIF